MKKKELLFDKISPKWQTRINRCVDIARMIAIESPSKNEILFDQLKDSIYAHLQSRLEAFIFIFTNISFVCPTFIPQSIEVYKFFNDYQSHENIFGKAKTLIYKQLFHWYFGDPSDNIYVFILHIFLQLIENNLIEINEFVNKIKKKFKKKSIYHDQLCLMSLFFSPEIQTSDPTFYSETQNYIQHCRSKGVLNSKVYLLLIDYDKYKSNDWDYLKKVRKMVPDVDYELFKSILNDDLESFTTLFKPEQGGILENPPFSPFNLLDVDVPYLNAAALFGSEKIFKHLYESGFSLHSFSKNGGSIDQFVCITPKAGIISILEEENVKFPYALSGLSRCLNHNSINEFMYLVNETELGVNPTGSTPLNMAIMCCNFLLFRVCLEKNPDVNLCDSYGMLPIDYACQFGNIVFYKALLMVGAKAEIAKAAFYAANYGNTCILQKILKNKDIDPDLYDEKTDMTPLKAAMVNSHYGAVKILMQDQRIDLFRRFKNNLTYLNFAASQNDVRTMKLAMESIHIELISLPVSPLFNSIFAGCTNMTEFLLFDIKIDPFKLTKDSKINALWLSVKCSSYEIAEILLQKDVIKLTANEIVLAQNQCDNLMIEILSKYNNLSE